jgi:hypothetical protein
MTGTIRKGSVAQCISALTRGLLVFLAAGSIFSAHAQYSSFPLYDTFNYNPPGTTLDGKNGWEIFAGGVTNGVSIDKYLGWLGLPGGTASRCSPAE